MPDFDSSNYLLWEHVNLSRQAHARLLASFFQKSLSTVDDKFDDLVSEDYRFAARSLDAWNEADKDKLNKGLLHLSYRRHGRTSLEKRWNERLLNAVHRRAVEFIEHMTSPNWPDKIQIENLQ